MRGLNSNYRRQQEQRAAHRRDAQQHEEQINAYIVVSASIDSVSTEQKATRYEQTTREDARRLREWLTIIALVITAAVGGYGIWRTHRDTMEAISDARTAADQQHRDTLDALAVAQKNLFASRRPWLRLPEDIKATSPLTLTEDGRATLTLSVTVRNVGNSPAFNVWFDPALHVDIPPVFNLTEVTNKYICPQLAFWGQTAFQNLGIPSFKLVMPNDTATLSTQTGSKWNAHKDRLDIFISVCVQYTDEFNMPHGIGKLLYYSNADGKAILLPKPGMIAGKMTPVSGEIVK